MFGIGVAMGHDIVVHRQNLLNFPWVDGIISQSVHKCNHHTLSIYCVKMRFFLGAAAEA